MRPPLLAVGCQGSGGGGGGAGVCPCHSFTRNLRVYTLHFVSDYDPNRSATRLGVAAREGMAGALGRKVDSHSEKVVREVLKRAVADGWKFEPTKGGGHSFGRLICPHGQCTQRIYSTPKSPENHAQRLQDLVGHCGHTRASRREIANTRSTIAKISSYLLWIERRIEHEISRLQAEQLLNIVDEADSASVEGAFDRLAETVEDMEHLELQAHQRIKPPRPDRESEIMDVLMDLQKSTKKTAKSLRRAQGDKATKEPLVTEIASLNARIETCIVLLATSGEPGSLG